MIVYICATSECIYTRYHSRLFGSQRVSVHVFGVIVWHNAEDFAIFFINIQATAKSLSKPSAIFTTLVTIVS